MSTLPDRRRVRGGSGTDAVRVRTRRHCLFERNQNVNQSLQERVVIRHILRITALEVNKKVKMSNLLKAGLCSSTLFFFFFSALQCYWNFPVENDTAGVSLRLFSLFVVFPCLPCEAFQSRLHRYCPTRGKLGQGTTPPIPHLKKKRKKTKTKGGEKKSSFWMHKPCRASWLCLQPNTSPGKGSESSRRRGRGGD